MNFKFFKKKMRYVNLPHQLGRQQDLEKKE
jgi:hypothetical protein